MLRRRCAPVAICIMRRVCVKRTGGEIWRGCRCSARLGPPPPRPSAWRSPAPARAVRAVGTTRRCIAPRSRPQPDDTRKQARASACAAKESKEAHNTERSSLSRIKAPLPKHRATPRQRRCARRAHLSGSDACSLFAGAELGGAGGGASSLLAKQPIRFRLSSALGPQQSRAPGGSPSLSSQKLTNT